MPERITLVEGEVPIVLTDQDFRLDLTETEREFDDALRRMSDDTDKFNVRVNEATDSLATVRTTASALARTTDLLRMSLGEAGMAVDRITGSINIGIVSAAQLQATFGDISTRSTVLFAGLSAATVLAAQNQKFLADAWQKGFALFSAGARDAIATQERLSELQTEAAEKAAARAAKPIVSPEEVAAQQAETARLARRDAQERALNQRINLLEREFLVLTKVMQPTDFILNAEERRLAVAVDELKTQEKITQELEQQEKSDRSRGARNAGEAMEDFEAFRLGRTRETTAALLNRSLIEELLPLAADDKGLRDDLLAFAERSGFLGPVAAAGGGGVLGGRSGSIGRLSLTAPGDIGGALLSSDRQEQKTLERKRTSLLEEIKNTLGEQLRELQGLDFGLG